MSLIRKTLCLIASLLVATTAHTADVPLAGDRIATSNGEAVIHPIEHATFALSWSDKTLYVDPVGGKEKFQSLPKPDLILVTDIHGDHMDAETIQSIARPDTVIVVPPAVVEKLPRRLRKRVTPVPNGLALLSMGLEIQTVPMYNLTPGRLQYHAKGRGNGYVILLDGRRIYISGDTEDIPEMRALKDIDAAFICMNLPYTMTVEQAADAVRAFKPKVVYPYHYRGTAGMSDVEHFKRLVGDASDVEVRLLRWYAQE